MENVQIICANNFRATTSACNTNDNAPSLYSCRSALLKIWSSSSLKWAYYNVNAMRSRYFWISRFDTKTIAMRLWKWNEKFISGISSQLRSDLSFDHSRCSNEYLRALLLRFFLFLFVSFSDYSPLFSRVLSIQNHANVYAYALDWFTL